MIPIFCASQYVGSSTEYFGEEGEREAFWEPPACIEIEEDSFFAAAVALEPRDPRAAASAPKRDEEDGLAAAAAAAAAAFLRVERVSGPGEESSPVAIVVATSSTLLPLDAAFDIAH